MQNYVNLPEGYRELMTINMQKDKKLALIINILALVIFALMIVIAALFVPISNMLEELPAYFIRLVFLVAGMILYIVLHELTHGIFMRYYSGIRPKYGFTGLYAYAGSTAFFCRRCYIIIALAPVVILGIALAILNIFAARTWFWVIYLIQALNISGAVGDIYVTHKFLKLPADILVHDSGVEMTVYNNTDSPIKTRH